MHIDLLGISFAAYMLLLCQLTDGESVSLSHAGRLFVWNVAKYLFGC